MAAPTMPSLLEGLVAWWKCEEDTTYGHTLMDASGNGHHVQTEGSETDYVNNINWGVRSALTVQDGKNGRGFSPRTVYRLSEAALQLGNSSFAISFWFRIPAEYWDDVVPMVGKGNYAAAEVEYVVEWLGDAGHVMQVRVDDNGHLLESDACMPAMVPDTWYHCMVWRDGDENILGISINNQESTPVNCEDDSVNTGSTNAHPLWFGPPTDYAVAYPDLDEIGIWNRVLTVEERAWLNNAGAGNFFDDIEAETDAEVVLACVSTSCCPPTEFSNEAECAAQDASVAAPILEPCRTKADLAFDPPSGSIVVYPIFVRIYTEHPLASIRYTTDGSEPTDSSPLYFEPIAVEHAGTVIKARTYVTGCPDGDVESGVWPVYGEDEIIFCFMGVTPDKVGKWGEFSGNGNDDLQWWLEINNIADSEEITSELGEEIITEEGEVVMTEDDFSTLSITRFELYQLDEDFKWTTGQAWSTAEYIRPPFDTWDQDELFHVFPLVFYDQTPAQINTAYTDDWGLIPSGSAQYNLFGQPLIPPDGYFMLIIYLSDGRMIRLMGDQDECDEPPPCPTLDPPVLEPLCKRIDVTMEMPGAAKQWELYAAACTNPSSFFLVMFGTGSGTLSYSHIELLPNCEYCFYWRINYAGDATYAHCGWVASATACATTSCEPSASLAADPEVLCLGGSFDLDYITTCAKAPTTISLVSGTAANLNVVFPQTVAPNTSGSITITPTAIGTWLFRLTATSLVTGCAADTSDASVEVITVPEYEDVCTRYQAAVRILAYRQSPAGSYIAMDNDVITFSPVPSDGFYETCVTGANSNECSRSATQHLPISAIWNFFFSNQNRATHCYWPMSGGQAPYGVNCSRLAINKAFMPHFYFYTHNCPAGGPGGTCIYPGFTNKWVLQLVAKILCGPDEVSTCTDNGGVVIWRGIKGCAGGPLGEYISDWYSAAPDAAVQTRVENSQVYSLLV